MERPHIFMLPSPGMGHFIPLIELAKILASHHRVSATILVPTTGSGHLTPAQKPFLDSLPNGINYLLLPPVELDDVVDDARFEVRVLLLMSRSIPFVRDAMAGCRISAFVADPFGIDAFEIAKEFGIPSYLYFPASATSLVFFLHLPDLDGSVFGEFGDLPSPVLLPGCAPLHGKDLLDSVQDRKNEAYQWILHLSKKARVLPDGIMLNSFAMLEPGPIRALLQEKLPGPTAIYPIGPVIQSGSVKEVDRVEREECLTWLDDQPDGSVLFISFGSGGTLSYDQHTELALGLEKCDYIRFIWVIRIPNCKSSNRPLLSPKCDHNPLEFLPRGFVERTKARGMVMNWWAPQIDILSHRSTGGFLTHCGWNSTLEAIVHGVPLIGWPLYAEQKMNAMMLHETLEIALMPQADPVSGLTDNEEIARVVKDLMEGEDGKRVRHRIKDLSEATKKFNSEDGDSTKLLAQVILKWGDYNN
uniref:Glycosyltransferase n=1 Tax=Fagopyrum esculentum TaxID=3617 RepID=A0A0A1H7L4_FAGES|nr:UDP-glycose: glycosyltransferase UGT72AC1 [Fagopyrum esculentum]